MLCHTHFDGYPGRDERRRGIVLMEVIFALALFAAGAATVLSAIQAGTRTAIRLRTEAMGDDLVVTLLSEIQMGLLAPQDIGPEDFEDEPYLGWTWQIVTSQFEDVIEAPGLKRVEIVVSYPAERHTRRLTVLVPDPLARQWDAQSDEFTDEYADEDISDPWEEAP